MHNYTVQNRYNTKTKLGNWYEESELNDYQFKEFLYQKDAGLNQCLNTQSKLAFSNSKVQLTNNIDGLLHFGDWIMLQNLCTDGALAFNIYESILGEQTYAVTTSKYLEPVLRNTFQIQPLTENSSPVIRYGDKVRFVTYVNDRKLYLQSIAVSPMRSSKFSRQQEVSITTQLNSNSIWVFDHMNPKFRFDSVGQEIKIADQLLIRHNSTSQWLASQKINYVNEFGAEFETFGKSFLSNNKSQNLFSQKVGHKSVENPMRGQGIQNSWRIIYGGN